MPRGNNWLRPAVAGMVLWGFWAFVPKLALKTLSIPAVLFYEGVGNMMVAAALVGYLKGKVIRDPKGVAITAVASWIAIAAIGAYYYALRLGPTATIVTVTSMYPVVGLLLARIFLGEKLNRLQVFAAALALGSIALLAG